MYVCVQCLVYVVTILCLVDTKLAPIFGKRTKQQPQSGSKPTPVLTEAEKQALEVRRAFLTSGVPEELKRQKPCIFVPAVDTLSSIIWPTDSHIQQRPASVSDVDQLPGHFDPWSLQRCDLRYRKLAIGNVAPPASLTVGLFRNALEKVAYHNIEVCTIWFFLFSSKVIRYVKNMLILIVLDVIVTRWGGSDGIEA